MIDRFEAIKNLVVEAPSLSYPSDERTFILDKDASDFVRGGVLSQLMEELEHVICYGSSVAVDYRCRRYKSIWKFQSIIDMDFSISIYRVSSLTWAIMS